MHNNIIGRGIYMQIIFVGLSALLAGFVQTVTGFGAGIIIMLVLPYVTSLATASGINGCITGKFAFGNLVCHNFCGYGSRILHRFSQISRITLVGPKGYGQCAEYGESFQIHKYEGKDKLFPPVCHLCKFFSIFSAVRAYHPGRFLVRPKDMPQRRLAEKGL